MSAPEVLVQVGPLAARRGVHHSRVQHAAVWQLIVGIIMESYVHSRRGYDAMPTSHNIVNECE